MGEVIHKARLTISQEADRIRRVVLEGFEGEPAEFGLHGGYQQFYKVAVERERPATLDYVAAALAA